LSLTRQKGRHAHPARGPSLHILLVEDECFYILDGVFSFLYQDRAIFGSPVTVLHVPDGVWPTLKNAENSPARVLLVVSPAGLDEFRRKKSGYRLMPPKPDLALLQ
jgi:quercetin dioxygenase-like cupin family protein